MPKSGQGMTLCEVVGGFIGILAWVILWVMLSYLQHLIGLE
jgi:hypothetical protein